MLSCKHFHQTSLETSPQPFLKLQQNSGADLDNCSGSEEMKRGLFPPEMQRRKTKAAEEFHFLYAYLNIYTTNTL